MVCVVHGMGLFPVLDSCTMHRFRFHGLKKPCTRPLLHLTPPVHSSVHTSLFGIATMFLRVSFVCPMPNLLPKHPINCYANSIPPLGRQSPCPSRLRPRLSLKRGSGRVVLHGLSVLRKLVTDPPRTVSKLRHFASIAQSFDKASLPCISRAVRPLAPVNLA